VGGSYSCTEGLETCPELPGSGFVLSGVTALGRDVIQAWGEVGLHPRALWLHIQHTEGLSLGISSSNSLQVLPVGPGSTLD
jgi:hypothetical protein